MSQQERLRELWLVSQEQSRFGDSEHSQVTKYLTGGCVAARPLSVVPRERTGSNGTD